MVLNTNNSNPLKQFQAININHILPVSLALGVAFTVDSSTPDGITVFSLLL